MEGSMNSTPIDGMEGSITSLTPISPITSRSSPSSCSDIDVAITSQEMTESFTLQLPTSTTIGTLRSLINLRTNIAQETISILHGPASEKVTLLTKTLADFVPASEDESSSNALAFGFKVEAPVRPKAKKQRCAFGKCTDRIVPIVGDCTFCSKRFCRSHRTLQMHMCPGREESNALAWQRNADALIKNRTVSTKGL